MQQNRSQPWNRRHATLRRDRRLRSTTKSVPMWLRSYCVRRMYALFACHPTSVTGQVQRSEWPRRCGQNSVAPRRCGRTERPPPPFLVHRGGCWGWWWASEECWCESKKRELCWNMETGLKIFSGSGHTRKTVLASLSQKKNSTATWKMKPDTGVRRCGLKAAHGREWAAIPKCYIQISYFSDPRSNSLTCQTMFWPFRTPYSWLNANACPRCDDALVVADRKIHQIIALTPSISSPWRRLNFCRAHENTFCRWSTSEISKLWRDNLCQCSLSFPPRVSPYWWSWLHPNPTFEKSILFFHSDFSQRVFPFLHSPNSDFLLWVSQGEMNSNPVLLETDWQCLRHWTHQWFRLRHHTFLFSKFLFLHLPLQNGFRIVTWTEIDAREHRKTQDAEQTEKMIPLIAGVNLFDLDFGLIIDSVKQPVKRDSLGSGHVSHRRTSALNDHLDHCFIFFRNVQLKLRIEKSSALVDIVIHIRQLIHFSVTGSFRYGIWVGASDFIACSTSRARDLRPFLFDNDLSLLDGWSLKNATLLSQRLVDREAGFPSICKPASKEITSDSVEAWNTDVCFLHIQLMGHMFDIRKFSSCRQKKSESGKWPKRQCRAVFPTW